MADLRLNKAHGEGGAGSKVVHTTTQSLANDDTYDTGLSGGVEQAFANATGDNGNIACVSGFDGSGTLTVELVDDAGSAVTSSEDIDILAIGTR